MIFLEIEDLDSIVAWEKEHYAEGVTHIDVEKEFTVEVSPAMFHQNMSHII